MKKDEMTYAQAMARLEEIVKRLETGEVSVDELAGAVKEGVRLVEWCRKKLRTAEADVETALKGLDSDASPAQDAKPTRAPAAEPAVPSNDDEYDPFS